MLDEREYTVEVDGRGGAPLRIVHLLDRSVRGWPHAVISDKNINPSEAGDGSRYQIRSRLCTGKVARSPRTVFRAKLFDQLLCLLLGLLIAEKYPSASIHKHSHRGRTNTTRAPGDESNLAR